MLSEGENKFNLLACSSKVVVVAQWSNARLEIKILRVQILHGAGFFIFSFVLVFFPSVVCP